MSERAIRKAAELYQKFTEFDPKHVDESPYSIPAHVRCVGEMKTTMYASDKWEKKVHSYKHDHDPGVFLYFMKGTADSKVPQWLRAVEALTRLGRCIGLETTDGEAFRATGADLYATPNGKALVVISKSTKRIEALIWGGRLTVEDRGIVH